MRKAPLKLCALGQNLKIEAISPGGKLKNLCRKNIPEIVSYSVFVGLRVHLPVDGKELIHTYLFFEG